jgi:hypothetical protein
MENADKVVVVEACSSGQASTEADGSKHHIDVFAVPHTRMRDLVSWPLSEVASAADVQVLGARLRLSTVIGMA